MLLLEKAGTKGVFSYIMQIYQNGDKLQWEQKWSFSIEQWQQQQKLLIIIEIMVTIYSNMALKGEYS